MGVLNLEISKCISVYMFLFYEKPQLNQDFDFRSLICPLILSETLIP